MEIKTTKNYNKSIFITYIRCLVMARPGHDHFLFSIWFGFHFIILWLTIKNKLFGHTTDYSYQSSCPSTKTDSEKESSKHHQKLTFINIKPQNANCSNWNSSEFFTFIFDACQCAIHIEWSLNHLKSPSSELMMNSELVKKWRWIFEHRRKEKMKQIVGNGREPKHMSYYFYSTDSFD